MSIGTEATVKKFVLHRIAIIVAAIAISTEALALAAGWGGGHGGGGLGAGHFGELGGSHFGGAMNGGPLGGRGEPHFAGGLHHRSWFREANITAVVRSRCKRGGHGRRGGGFDPIHSFRGRSNETEPAPESP